VASAAAVTRAVVRVEDFRKRYGRQEAVTGVTFAVAPGQLYGLIGPDGAGKSSVMKAVAGVLTFDGGRVELFGTALDSERTAERVKDRLGFMPQGLGLNLYPDLSVEENIEFFARLRLVPPDALAERKERLLGMTRLAPFRARTMKQLSGGMKQKLGLVCTLIHEPALLILDEPTTGVDPVSRRDFWAILAELLGGGQISALVSTAYMDEAARFHRLALMHGGRLIAEGEPDEVRALVKGRLVTLRAEPQMPALERLRARRLRADAHGTSIRVIVPDVDPQGAIQYVRDVLDGLTIGDPATDEPELEDVFVTLLGETRTGEPPGALPRDPSVRHGDDGGAIGIDAVELTRDFADFRAVDRVSFTVRPGEIFGLLGANGAGKTTVIKMLTGILPPTAGHGHVAGVDMRRPARSIKKRIGYMSQAFSLYQDLTPVENITLYAGIYGLTRAETRERLAWILELGGLAGHERTPAGRLPMGMRQRLALGCALVHRPRALFLDEPTSGVDPIGRRRFWDILFMFAREDGVAVLITTHHMSEAEHCDRLALMFAGRIVADAAPDAMKRAVEAEVGRRLELVVDRPADAVRCLVTAGIGATLWGRRVHVLSRDPSTDASRLATLLEAARVRLHAATTRPLSMEDVFVARVTALEAQRTASRVAS
jgi:ABC-2 type transport system ATP-binding protein